MKKLKLLPTILMLVLCVGVLAIGIYAVTPTKNTISGSITINAANAPVLVQLFIDGESQGEPKELRGGFNWDIGELEFNISKANSLYEVKNKIVTFKIQNKSTTQSLGAYFFKNGSTLATNNLATGENIMLTDQMFINGSDTTNNANKIADVECTPYMYIATYDDESQTNTVYDTVEMTLNFSLYQFFTSGEKRESTIDYCLNIEPYTPNIATQANTAGLPIISPGVITSAEYEDDGYTVKNDYSITNETSGFNNSLLKLPDTNYSTISAASFYGNEYIQHVVVPPCVTEVEFIQAHLWEDNPMFSSLYSCAFDCKNLKAISWSGIANLKEVGVYAGCPGYPFGSIVGFTTSNVTLCINATSFGYGSGVLDEAFGTSIFGYMKSLTKLHLQNTEIIGSYSFIENGGLSLLVIPKTVTQIQEGAFSSYADVLETKIIIDGCTNLKFGNDEAWGYGMGYPTFGSAPTIVFYVNKGTTVVQEEVEYSDYLTNDFGYLCSSHQFNQTSMATSHTEDTVYIGTRKY